MVKPALAGFDVDIVTLRNEADYGFAVGIGLLEHLA